MPWDRDVEARVETPAGLSLNGEGVRSATGYLVLLEHDDPLAELREDGGARKPTHS